MEARRRGRARPDFGEGAVIKDLVARGRSQDRVVVRLHDAGSLELARVLVEQAGLQPGMMVTGALLERLIAEDAPYWARERALRLLEVRDRAERELESRLKAEGVEPGMVAATLDWLRGLGYVNDKRFASRFTASKLAAGWGVRRIRVGLLQKGVDRSVIEESLAEAMPRDTPQTDAVSTQAKQGTRPGAESEGPAECLLPILAVVRRRFAKHFATDPDAAARRLAGFLARRGHDWETIGRIEAVLRAEAHSTADASVDERGVDGLAGFS